MCWLRVESISVTGSVMILYKAIQRSESKSEL